MYCRKVPLLGGVNEKSELLNTVFCTTNEREKQTNTKPFTASEEHVIELKKKPKQFQSSGFKHTIHMISYIKFKSTSISTVL